MGRHVRKPDPWWSRHWETMLIVVPVGAVAVVASIIAATKI